MEDILGGILDGSGEDSRAVQDMAKTLAQQLGSEPSPRSAGSLPLRNSPSPGATNRAVSVSTPSMVHTPTVATAAMNGARPAVTAAQPPKFVNAQTVGQISSSRPTNTTVSRSDGSTFNVSMQQKLADPGMREKVNRLRQLLGRLIEMASQKDQKFGEVMRELVKKLLDGNITDALFITEIDRIGGIKLQSQAANFPNFLATTLPYLRFQLQQETRAIFQEKVQKKVPATVVKPAPSPEASSTAAGGVPHTAAPATAMPPAAATQSSPAAAVQQLPPGATAANPGGMLNQNALRHILQRANQQKMLEVLKTTPQFKHIFLQQQQQQASLAAAKRVSLATAAAPNVTTTSLTVPLPVPTATAVAASASPKHAVSASHSAPKASSKSTPAKSKHKPAKDEATADDDNDLTLVGVNLREETAILTGAENVPLQTQTCDDQTLLSADPLRALIERKAKERGLDSVAPEVIQLMSHAMEARLRDTVEKLTVINQHRAESYKDDVQIDVTSQVRSQLRFLEEIDRFSSKKRAELQREMLLKAAKSRARPDDPEAALLKEKARQVQHEEEEVMRKNAANVAALAAIGPRKRRKPDEDPMTAVEAAGTSAGPAAQPFATQLRTRQRRIALRDYIFYLEQEKLTRKSKELFHTYLKQT